MSRRDREAAGWFARMRGPHAAANREAFEAWRRDPANAAAYADAEADWVLAARVPRPHGAARAMPGPTRLPQLRWAVATIGAAALALGFTWTIGTGRDGPRLAESSVRDSERRLPDGSSVRLGDGARIEVRYSPRERRIVLLGGRGRFAVAHDTARPFVVAAGGSETTALGTVFEVDLRDGPVIVKLIKGSVEVRAAGTASTVRLGPGERASVEDRIARVVPAMTIPVAATQIDADRIPLAQVVGRANQVNDMPIELADPALGAIELTGRFDIADSASLARKLAAALDLDVETRGAAIRLSAKDKKKGG